MADTNDDVQQSDGGADPKRGFANMSEDRIKEVARLGGKAAQAKGKAHRFTSETGKVAGSKGGKAAQKSGKAFRLSGDKAREAARAGVAKRRAAKAAHQELTRKANNQGH